MFYLLFEHTSYSVAKASLRLKIIVTHTSLILVQYYSWVYINPPFIVNYLVSF